MLTAWTIPAMLVLLLQTAYAGIGMGYYPNPCDDPKWEVAGWRGGGNIQQALADVDKDLDGTITDEELRTSLYDYDSNGNGFVERCEFVQRASERYLIPVKVANVLFGFYDSNSDGRLDYLDIDRNAEDLNKDGRLDVCEVKKGTLTSWLQAKTELQKRQMQYLVQMDEWDLRTTGRVRTWNWRGIFTFMVDLFSL